MVAEPRTFVDVEGAVRAWARDVLPTVEGRVFFAVSDSAAFPQITLFRVSGPDEAARIQFGVYGGTKAEAAQIAADLATAVEATSQYVSGAVLLHGAAVDSIRWQPDPASDRPRYVVDVIVAATPV